jgi:hypothetical protein
VADITVPDPPAVIALLRQLIDGVAAEDCR